MPYSTAKKQCKWNVLCSHEISPKARRNVCVKLRGLSKWSNLWIRNNIIVDFSMKDKVCSSKHIRGYMYICELPVTQHASRLFFLTDSLTSRLRVVNNLTTSLTLGHWLIRMLRVVMLLWSIPSPCSPSIAPKTSQATAQIDSKSMTIPFSQIKSSRVELDT